MHREKQGKSVNQEIERKFIVYHNQLPPLVGIACVNCMSGFIQDVNGQNAIRLREEHSIRIHDGRIIHLDTRYYMTAKQGKGLVRTETIHEISERTFVDLWPSLQSKIFKKRFLLTYGDRVIELDVFERNLSGLIIAEVEFPSEEAANDFIKPDWFGPEVTEEPEFFGINLGKVKNISELPIPPQ